MTYNPRKSPSWAMRATGPDGGEDAVFAGEARRRPGQDKEEAPDQPAREEGQGLDLGAAAWEYEGRYRLTVAKTTTSTPKLKPTQTIGFVPPLAAARGVDPARVTAA